MGPQAKAEARPLRSHLVHLGEIHLREHKGRGETQMKMSDDERDNSRRRGTWRLGRIGRAGMEKGDGDKGADERARRREQHVAPMLRVVDDGERGEQVPDAAPRGCRQAAPAQHGVGEQHIDRVGAGGSDDDSRGDQGIDGDRGHRVRSLCLRHVELRGVPDISDCAGDLSACGLVLHCNNGRTVLYAGRGV